jgi:hypothetical protein
MDIEVLRYFSGMMVCSESSVRSAMFIAQGVMSVQAPEERHVNQPGSLLRGLDIRSEMPLLRSLATSGLAITIDMALLTELGRLPQCSEEST